MTSDRVLAIFDKLRLSLWRLRSSILVDYEIEDKLADDENRTKLSIHFEDEHFDLDASMLAGQYVPEIQPSLDVKYWCASKLQAWREGEEAKAPASTIHGLAWMEIYEVVFDPNANRPRLGVRLMT